MILVAAILIYFIGKMIVGWIANMVKKLMTRSKVDSTLVVFIGNIVHAFLLLFVIIAAIGRLGV
ncbi:MAG: hypothetical protein U1B83_05270, partial [Candidatus Cloacimonadaceae bacterium]|nr:hypothetical protein [Candidatus Cloacimonadaceae bacterium]